MNIIQTIWSYYIHAYTYVNTNKLYKTTLTYNINKRLFAYFYFHGSEVV